MSENTAPESGATDDQRTDSESTETTMESDASLDELAAENRELRGRVEELEATIESMQDSLGEEATTERTAEPDSPTAEPAETLPLVTGGGQDCKVIGEFTSQSGIGVYGHNQATSGTATGVKGETNSSDAGATAIKGESTASSGQTYGVHGAGDAPSSFGVVGDASSGSLPSIPTGQPVGVLGHTDRSGSDTNVTDGYAVVGYATASSGLNYGVYGQSDSSDGFGVYSFGNSKVTEDHLVQGDIVTNVDGDRTSRLYFGDDTTPHGRLVHDNTEDTFTLSSNTKSGDTFEVQMDVELNQDGTTQKTGGPIAKGFIKSDGTIANAVNIDSASWDSTNNFYEVAITGVTYSTDEYAVQVTPQRSPTESPLGVKTNYTADDNLSVAFENDKQSDFSLTVWDLPSGTVTT